MSKKRVSTGSTLLLLVLFVIDHLCNWFEYVCVNIASTKRLSLTTCIEVLFSLPVALFLGVKRRCSVVVIVKRAKL
jgi:hypothetical protein